MNNLILDSTVEPIEYRGRIDDASPKGTIVTARGPGFSFSYPNGVRELLLSGKDTSAPVRWEVVIHPGSKLKPLD